ncbi:MAG: hypothetical protein LBE78_10540 [Burkholderiaceae bacterium]|jgi:hypothetical protein|nr:hypothetical protein [Burkholderiaceae bacterium]
MAVNFGSLFNSIAGGVTSIVANSLMINPAGIVGSVGNMVGGIMGSVGADSEATGITSSVLTGVSDIVATSLNPISWLNPGRIVSSVGDMVGNIVGSTDAGPGATGIVSSVLGGVSDIVSTAVNPASWLNPGAIVSSVGNMVGNVVNSATTGAAKANEAPAAAAQSAATDDAAEAAAAAPAAAAAASPSALGASALAALLGGFKSYPVQGAGAESNSTTSSSATTPTINTGIGVAPVGAISGGGGVNENAVAQTTTNPFLIYRLTGQDSVVATSTEVNSTTAREAVDLPEATGFITSRTDTVTETVSVDANPMWIYRLNGPTQTVTSVPTTTTQSAKTVLSVELTATAGGTTLNGSPDGNDILSDGGYQNVTLNGGTGNDVFLVNCGCGPVIGGAGTDTMLLTGTGRELNLNLVRGVEHIDLGQKNALMINLGDVLNGPDTPQDQLVLTGDVTDTVILSSDYGHVAGNTKVIDDTAYDIWLGFNPATPLGLATVLIEQGIQVEVMAAV